MTLPVIFTLLFIAAVSAWVLSSLAVSVVTLWQAMRFGRGVKND